MERHGMGCLGKVAVAGAVCAAVAFGVGWLALGPLRRSVETRILLEAQFGPQEGWTPGVDGAVSSDRLAVFCAVRHQLVEACDDLRVAEERMLSLSQFDGQDDVPRRALAGRALDTVRGGLSLGPIMGEFFERRNRALLESGMGLGEYTYIYVVAYHGRLVDRSSDARLFDGPPVNPRVLRALRSMLAHQLEATEAAHAAPELAAALEAEVAAMDQDPSRLPWSDGLPEAVAASLGARRQELDELFCDVAAPLELQRNERHGPGIHTR